MRGLRVVGLDGATLILADPQTDQRFGVPCDDRLRAAVRGELDTVEQPVLEGDPQMRPKEIQSRIRSGASVEEVAALAGTSIRRISTYAHPVLLERATVAEKARTARPSIDGISGSIGVQDTVRATLSSRGHEGELTWDAFKDGNDWVLSLTWTVGRSSNRALWTYHRGADGGTLTARNDAATEIVDPALKVLRPLREVKPSPRPDVVTGTLLDPTVPTAPAEAVDRSAADEVERTVTDERSAALPAEQPAQVARTGTDSRTPAPAGQRSAKRGSRPAMPSWEDVLIGTRSTRK